MKLRESILFTFLLITFPGICQDNAFSLLTERYVERPLSMHRRQLQINSGYEFSSLNKLYDFKGNSLDLNEEGIASAKHLFPVEIKYGILEWLQVGASMNYARMGLRTQNFNFITNAGKISHSEIKTWTGFDDLFLGVDLTAPVLPDVMNWVVSGGIVLPVFDHESDQPAHKIDFFNFYSDSTVIQYRYHYKFGNGIPIANIGTSLKFRFSKLAIATSFYVEKSLSEGESIYWQSRIAEGEVQYQKIEYQYDLGQTLDYHASLAYQAINWLAVIFYYNGMNSAGGWTTETGKKVGTGRISINSLGVGYEIQVSIHLRLNQVIDIPVSGENTMAYWIFRSGISLNLIPSGN